MTKEIVWIDDDTDIIFPLVTPLEKLGCNVSCIDSVEQALNEIERIRNSDLIMLDIILPPGDVDRLYGRYAGVELLEELQSQHDIETPVIVVSVVTREDVHRQLWEMGVKDILTKPVLPSDLKQRVLPLLGQGMGSSSTI